MSINTVKYEAELNASTVIIGYLVNGVKHVPMDDANRDYVIVQEWIGEGNTPEPAYTQAELDAYAIQANNSKIDARINNLTVTVGGKDYSGSPKIQGELAFAIQVLTDKTAGETLSRRAIDGSINELELDDFKALEVAISDKQEALLHGGSVESRQLLIDELIGQSTLAFVNFTTVDRNGMTEFIANGAVYTLTGNYLNMPHGRDLYNSVGETESNLPVAIMISQHINQGTYFDFVDNLFRK